MEKLLASSPPKILKLTRGQKVTGIVLEKTPKELILEIGGKAEGILGVKDLGKDQMESIKVGDTLEAYVIFPENESGQVILAMYKGTSWAKFQNALNQKKKLSGKVLEINKGGLIIDVDGTRGFLPNSQVGFNLLVSLKEGLETLVGQTINVNVAEIDFKNNRLIFSQRGGVSPDVLEKIKKFKINSKVKGKIVAILPFGLVIDLGGVEGLVFISDVSWEKVEDLSSLYTLGQMVEAKVISVDEDLGRVNLSIKHLTSDPFEKLSYKYPTDQVAKGQIMEVTTGGVVVKLEDGLMGFLPASKMDADIKYSVGQNLSFLVDSVDKNKRRINLAPFVTSTEGLIYK